MAPYRLDPSFPFFICLILWYDCFQGVSVFLRVLNSWQKARLMSNMSASTPVQLSTVRVRQRTSEDRVTRQQRVRRLREGTSGENRGDNWLGPRRMGLSSRSWVMEAPSFPYSICSSTHVSVNGTLRGRRKKKFRQISLERQSYPKSLNPIFPVLMPCPKMPESYHSNEFTN